MTINKHIQPRPWACWGNRCHIQWRRAQCLAIITRLPGQAHVRLVFVNFFSKKTVIFYNGANNASQSSPDFPAGRMYVFVLIKKMIFILIIDEKHKKLIFLFFLILSLIENTKKIISDPWFLSSYHWLKSTKKKISDSCFFHLFRLQRPLHVSFFFE